MNAREHGSREQAVAPGRRGSRNEHTHRRNLSTILTLVHQRGPQSRATLTRLTGLNRSTTGALVAELHDLGLVTETPSTEGGSVGRPSPIVAPSENIQAITVNPDIDAITVAHVSLGGTVQHRTRIETASPTVEDTIDAIVTTVGNFRRDSPPSTRFVGLAVAVPGLVRTADGMVTRAPHLEWENVALRDLLADRLQWPTFIGNDAHVAMMAESIFGAGRDCLNMVYLNGSASGIGGGAFVDGVPLRGATGYAGELGHTLVTSNGIPCHCGRRGCLETEVNVQRLATASSVSPSHLGDFVDDWPTEITPGLAAELDRQADVLGHGIANLISVFNPETVVLGGFLSHLYEGRRDRVDAAVTADAFAPLAEGVRITGAHLEENLLMVGAAELAFAPLLHDPVGARNM